MKKLISSIILALGVLTMVYAVEYTTPSSDFVLIKGGSFTMGSPETKTGAVMMKLSTALLLLHFI